MLPFIALGTVLAAAASESDWRDELRKPLAFRGKGLVVASWKGEGWELRRHEDAFSIRPEGGAFKAGTLLPPHPKWGPYWEIGLRPSPSSREEAIFNKAFPSVWTLLRHAMPPEDWEEVALTSTIQAVSRVSVDSVNFAMLASRISLQPDLLDWDGHPTWQARWRAMLVKPDFVHPGLRLTSLGRAAGRVPLLAKPWFEIKAELGL